MAKISIAVAVLTSEPMGFHDSEIMDDRCIDRGDTGALGVFVARCEGADAAVVVLLQRFEYRHCGKDSL